MFSGGGDDVEEEELYIHQDVSSMEEDTICILLFAVSTEIDTW